MLPSRFSYLPVRRSLINCWAFLLPPTLRNSKLFITEQVSFHGNCNQSAIQRCLFSWFDLIWFAIAAYTSMYVSAFVFLSMRLLVGLRDFTRLSWLCTDACNSLFPPPPPPPPVGPVEYLIIHFFSKSFLWETICGFGFIGRFPLGEWNNTPQPRRWPLTPGGDLLP